MSQSIDLAHTGYQTSIKCCFELNMTRKGNNAYSTQRVVYSSNTMSTWRLHLWHNPRYKSQTGAIVTDIEQTWLNSFFYLWKSKRTRCTKWIQFDGFKRRKKKYKTMLNFLTPCWYVYWTYCMLIFKAIPIFFSLFGAQT